MEKDKGTRLIFDLGGKVKISPLIWPNARVKTQPGDLSKLLPSGNGVYGYQNKNVPNPFKSAPPQEATGGYVYFGNEITEEDFGALLRITEVNSNDKDYSVFIEESRDPQSDGFLLQMRVVPKFALQFMFHVIDEQEYESFPEQELSIGDLLYTFIESERGNWGTSFSDSPKLDGKFGGDGDFMREELSFGFMVENNYYGVCRIWSRAWLVTK
ncbi:hypothetical protein IPJ63_03165 [Candidatus Nomurabacteria bacterium]|nr:MAG: hypothetical protein IPJ63_03165 [Candidatus Nomurabacteria bacterium]